MFTILKLIELSTDYLSKKGIDSPRTNAEYLLAHVLNCSRMDLYLKFDQPLTEEETSEYRELIKRRGQREPLQYILGTVEFYGLEFKVDRNVLIPRNETELLVEEIIKFAKDKKNLKVLDIGTGSGNIAISLMKNLNDIEIDAIDISQKAIDVANYNAKTLGLDGRISFESIDINAAKTSLDKKYDIVVSNPPYISEKDYQSLEPELLNYEPKEALTDELDGLSYYNLICSKASELIIKGGRIFFELGISQSSAVNSFMEINNFKDIRIIKDYQNIDRIITGELI